MKAENQERIEPLKATVAVYHNTNATQGAKILEQLAGPLTRIEGMNCFQDERGTKYVVTLNRIIVLSEYTAYDHNVPVWERPYITALLTEILKDGHTVSVYDGEEYVIKRTNDLAEITRALGGTGQDTIHVFSADNDLTRLGYFFLIYNNGSEDDPEIVLCDYSANEYSDQIVSWAREAI